VIRKEQQEVFSQYMRDSFINRMAIHLRKTFPDKTKELDDKSLKKIIENGISNAAKYEIRRECDVERYLNLMFALSFDFDTNKNTNWAGRIINLKDLRPELRMDFIYQIYEEEYSNG